MGVGSSDNGVVYGGTTIVTRPIRVQLQGTGTNWTLSTHHNMWLLWWEWYPRLL